MASHAVITGIGVVSPLGSGREAFWRACLDGRSAVRALDSTWVTETGLDTRIAATMARDYGASQARVPARLARFIDRTTLFALDATRQALEDAGFPLTGDPDRRDALQIGNVDPARVASLIGSGIGGLTTLEVSHARWREARSRTPIKRYTLPMLIPNAPAGQVALRHGARGECKALSTACAAGTMALGDAWRLIRDGEADVVLAGGAEGVAGDDDAYALLGFDRLRTLSTRNEEPERASRPFDRGRDGFVLGEGAAVLVLERPEFAAARGAVPVALIGGYASNCDAHSMVQIEESGRRIVDLIGAALRSAGLHEADVEHVSAHGTSTPLGDLTEARALRRAFGARCDEIPVTGLKSMTGHAIAASGPMETAAAALGLCEGTLAPTINHDDPDPDCDLDVVANRPRRHPARVALKLSYGFGGHNACLVLLRA